MLDRIILRDHADCSCCGVPLMPGEVAYRDRQTGIVGHSQGCCLDAVAELTDHHEVNAFRAGCDLNLVGGVCS